MIEEKLTRLNPKSQSFESSGGSFDSMTPQDLAAALSGLTPIQTFIVYKKWIDSTTRGEGYIKLWKDCFFKIIKAEALPSEKGKTVVLFDIALAEYSGEHLCPQCNGRAVLLLPGGHIHKCRSLRCNEGRVSTLKDKDKAKLMGVTPLKFSREYKKAYSIIADHLTRTLPEAETSALRLIQKKSRWHD